MAIADNINKILAGHDTSRFSLIAVSKNHPVTSVQEAYQSGQRHFGENKVQEMTEKQSQLPSDIFWHMIGHLQSNKVKYIAPFVYMIHSVDSLRLLQLINKEAFKNNRVINCLLQLHIAREETKHGMSWQEIEDLLSSTQLADLKNISVKGLMAMATNTDDLAVVRQEFREVKQYFELMKEKYNHLDNADFKEISMGMSGDYEIALDEGSTLIRVGSSIFGSRNY